MNDDKKEFFRVELGLTGNLTDLENRWLKGELGSYTGPLPDMWRRYLRGLGHIGPLSDKKWLLPYPLGKAAAIAYDAASSTLFDRMTTRPTTARKALINDLIVALKAGGVWDKLDAFYIMAAHDSQAAGLNWKGSSFELTPVASPSFEVDRGYTGDGTTSYLNTNYTPSMDGVQYQLNSGHLAVWSRTNSQESAGLALGCRTAASTNQALIQIRTTTDLGNARINQNTNPTGVSVTNSTGFFSISRLASASAEFYRNGSQITSFAITSTGRPTFPMFIGAINTAGTVSNGSARQHAIASVGAGLSSAETTAFYNAVNAYMQGVGAA